MNCNVHNEPVGASTEISSATVAQRVLFVALHFPPFARGSGYLRTVKFCQHLPTLGWQPIVLTASRKAYAPGDYREESAEASSFPVFRAFAIDTARQLSLFGKYPGWLALPDRWISWWPHAVMVALSIVRRYKPAAIVTTYPIATAHLIGLTVQRLTGVPWIADFRDPMVDEHYPSDSTLRSVRLRLESATMSRCGAAIFTSPSTRDLYSSRYPNVPSDRLSVVMNGYDEGDFASAEPSLASDETDRPLQLLHSGVLYPDVRDPSAFFAALRALKGSGEVSATKMRVVLRACGPEHHHRRLIDQYKIQDIVSIEPGIPYVEALREMMTADGLMLFQGRAANRQTPAKLFEYLRSGRPILALVDPDGDPARLLCGLGTALVARIDSTEEIIQALRTFIRHPELRSTWSATKAVASQFSRLASTRALTDVLLRVGSKSTIHPT